MGSMIPGGEYGLSGVGLGMKWSAGRLAADCGNTPGREGGARSKPAARVSHLPRVPVIKNQKI